MSADRVVVVGAGVAGLAAATALRRDAPELDVLVLERDTRVGGLVETERTADGLVVEHGADCLVTTNPWGLAAACDAGLGDAVIAGGSAPRRTYVSTRAGLVLLPPVFAGVGPESILALLQTPLLSLAGKARLAIEPFTPRRRDRADESVRAFITRRFGAEMAGAVVDPLLGGLYGGDTGRLSAEACLPRLRAFEREAGSVTRGVQRAIRARRRSLAAALPPAVSLRAGMGSLPGALAARLGARVALDADVRAISRRGTREFRVDTAVGTIDCAGIVLATPAWQAPPLVERLSADLAAALAAVPHKALACVTFAWPRSQVPHDLAGTGWVRGAGDDRPTLACTWSSEKWSGRAPAGVALVRSFMALEAAADEDLVAAARRDCRDMLGVADPPRFTMVRRLPRATPIYEVGHPERVERMLRAARGIGAFALAGNAYAGVGVSDCICSGEAAAQAVRTALAA